MVHLNTCLQFLHWRNRQVEHEESCWDRWGLTCNNQLVSLFTKSSVSTNAVSHLYTKECLRGHHHYSTDRL